ncbi:MAG: cytochrome-c peroxidase [Campylobacterales bacterium]
MKIAFILGLVASALWAEGLFRPIAPVAPIDAPRAALGQKLFHDPRLSKDATVSCATCHPLDAYGVDGLSVSLGIGGQKGELNAPTVFNTAFNLAHFWDGRAATLEEQAIGPIENPVEMGNRIENVIAWLSKDESYRPLFKEAYGGRVDRESITGALAEFQKTLITPGSRFDRFLGGEQNALNAAEREGFALFKTKGCVSCHNGINLGGNLYQRAGVVIPMAFEQDPAAWAGRYAVTKDEADRYYFKVPSLRNVGKTAPYFHDGSVTTLHEAVRQMAWHQLGRKLEEREVDRLVAFLGALEGRLEGYGIRGGR